VRFLLNGRFLTYDPKIEKGLAKYWCATSCKTYDPMEDVAVE
jgi:hypothetical protein